MKLEDELAGKLAAQALRGMKPLPDESKWARDRVIDTLRAVRFDLYDDYPVPTGKVRVGGKITLLARKGSGSVAIELNGRQPKARSVQKLVHVDAYRILVLRGKANPGPIGLDEVIGHGVHEVIALDVVR